MSEFPTTQRNNFLASQDGLGGEAKSHHESPVWERLSLELLGSAVNGAVQSPYNGIAQLVDHVSGSSLLPEAHFADQAPAQFGTADWYAQQFGSAAGMAGTFFALHKALGSGLSRLGLGGADAMAAGEAADIGVSRGGTLAQLSRSFGGGALSGAVYGAVLEPVDPREGDFWSARLNHTASTALTFGTLNASGTGLGALSERSDVAGTALGKALSHDAVKGVVAGLPAGLVSAESGSLLAGHGPASLKDVFQSAYSYAITGGALGLLSHAETNYYQRKAALATEAERQRPGVTLLLDGGGVRGWGHIGLLKYLEDQRVKVHDEYGVSIGALVATLHTNGYKAEQIKNIFYDEFHNPDVLKYLPKQGTLRELTRFTDLQPLMKYFVDKYNLKPNEHLHIITYGLRNRQSVRFEGTNYDLPKAMAASAAIPGPFRWVKYKPEGLIGMPGQSRRMTLIDGGVRETGEKDLPPGNIVISRLLSDQDPGLFTAILGQKLGPKLENLTQRVFKRNVGKSETESALVVNVGKPDVHSLGFLLPDETLFGMVDHGFERARAGLSSALGTERLPLWRQIKEKARLYGLFGRA